MIRCRAESTARSASGSMPLPLTRLREAVEGLLGVSHSVGSDEAE